ncbi:MAG: AMP-binding protein [Oscillospiraceae bacterium]|nr:AMP-binding protein [Oscillospiraceae bacterium]
MENYKRTVARDIDAITKSDKTLKDVYHVMFSHYDHFAYEQLVDYEIEAVTYKEFDLEIKAFAAYMRHTYPDISGEYVGIDLANSPNFLIALWGTLMSGNKPYLINSFYPSELRARLLKMLNVKIVITNATDYTDFTNVDINGYNKNCPQISDEHWQNEFALSSTLTGLEAKICVFDGDAVVNQLLNTQDVLKDNDWLISDYQNRIKIAMILPLFHIFGIMAGYFWLGFFGRTMVFLKDNSPETIRGTINRHNVTHIFAPPILFHKLYNGIMSGVLRESEKKQKKFQKGLKLAFALQNIFPSLGVRISKRLFKEVLTASFGASPQFMISGGAYIDSDALRVINCIGYPLFNGYGTTETAISGANLAKKISLRVDGSIGKPFTSINYTRKDDETLVVSGNSICKRIITFQGEESEFSSIETNDLIKTINGRHFIVGRKSDLYIGENGENISPDIIQNALEVKKANRFSVLELDGKLIIVLEYGEKLANEIIVKEIESIKEMLSKVTYGNNIVDIFATRQLIANPNAIKVSRALLRRKVAEGEVILTSYKELIDNAREQSDSVDDATMFSIKQAFINATNTAEEVKSDSDFFIDLGGTSLDYMMLISDLESMFGIQIVFKDGLNLRTPKCFHTYIKNHPFS